MNPQKKHIQISRIELKIYLHGKKLTVLVELLKGSAKTLGRVMVSPKYNHTNIIKPTELNCPIRKVV